jgi:predicted aspartyl protease
MGKNNEWPSRFGVRQMGRISIDLEVANFGDILRHREGKLPAERIRRLIMQGVVDPGATRMVLPEQVAQQLGLKATGKVRVTYADKRIALRDQVEGVYVTIQGRGGAFQATVEKKRSTAVIGAIVLEDLDFLIDCKNERLFPRDPRYVLKEIE